MKVTLFAMFVALLMAGGTLVGGIALALVRYRENAIA